MSINQIIEDELTQARIRIQQRVQNFLIGGPAELAPPPRAQAGGRPQVAGIKGLAPEMRDAMLIKALDFISKNPGCKGLEVTSAAGIPTDDINTRKWLMSELGPRIIKKGSASATVYYLKGAASAAEAEAEAKGDDKKKIRTPEERASDIKKLSQVALAFIKKHPDGVHARAIGLYLAEKRPAASSEDRVTAYNLLISERAVKAKKEGTGIGRTYYPL